MKKLIIATVFAVATVAQASPTASRVCGRLAEAMVTTASAARTGVTWDQIEEIHGRLYNSGSLADSVITSISRETFYNWSSFDDSTIRKLAYMKCMDELPPAVREDIRAKKAAQ